MHYLVMLRCNLDDLPVRLVDSREDAEKLVKEMDVDAMADELNEAGFLVSDPAYVSIVTFDELGVPGKPENIRDLDDE